MIIIPYKTKFMNKPFLVHFLHRRWLQNAYPLVGHRIINQGEGILRKNKERIITDSSWLSGHTFCFGHCT